MFMGLMDEQLWEGWRGLLRHYVAAPGIAEYWNLRPEVFSERFRNFVNSLEPPAEQRTVGTLFGEERKYGQRACLGGYGAQRRGYSMRIVVTCVRAVIYTVLAQG